ncbi:sugar MFS transporter [Aurantibacter crassamenti]|uniref:sugar MFS transporter n=1 Tax=Aurantibacter crassamenti TaxID=1837375 RepID=UPI0019394D0D|nr:sugar MFS transporter [Aurantibacter crassamenti]MBM1105060.1 sugar MFS transporter [Aurantibacter crassamenti]
MAHNKKFYRYSLAIIGLLFFVFGFLTWINGILIPYFKICMELSNFEATLVAFSSYFAYFVMALPSAYVLKHTGYKKGMVWGICVMAIGTLMFIPAAYSRMYPLFLGGLFVTATGLALVQTAANPYIAIMGPIEGTAQRIGYMGMANKVAGIVCLFVLGSVFLSDADGLSAGLEGLNDVQKIAALDSYALKIVNPYIIISIVLFAVAALVYFSKLPEVDEMASSKDQQGNILKDRKSVFEYPYLVMGVVALFVAGACETVPIDGIIIYCQALDIPMDTARHFSTYTLFVMLFGYLSVSILVPKYVSQHKALLFASIWGLVLTVATYLTSGIYSAYCMLFLGFSASMLWGTIWGLALRGLGGHTKKASAFMIMSLIGGGIVTVVFGDLLDTYSLSPQISVLILIPCYLFIFYYSIKGYRTDYWNKRNNTIANINK